MSYPNIFEFQEDFDKENILLGKGTYGEVYKMQTKRPINIELEESVEPYISKECAVKILSAASEKSFASIQKEFLILRSLPQQHPNIIRLYKTYAWANQLTKTYNLVLAMELADRSLQAEIDSRRKEQRYFEDDQLLLLFRQSIEGLNDIMTKANIFHRDIKPENMLLMKDGFHLKISDFGVSRKLIEEKLSIIPGTLVGTPVYLSPILWQSFERGEFNAQKVGKVPHNFEKSDIYSLGITMMQTTLLLKNEVGGLNKGMVGEERTMDLIKQIHHPIISRLLHRMLIHDEKQRASYQELLCILQDNILQLPISDKPKNKSQERKPIFTYVQPKSIKEQYSLSAKIQMQNNNKDQAQSPLSQSPSLQSPSFNSPSLQKSTKQQYQDENHEAQTEHGDNN